jgi:type IV secretion system protein VirD4
MGTGTVGIHQARFSTRRELNGLLHKYPCPDGVLLGQRKDYLILKRFVAVRPTKTRQEIGNTLIVAPTRGGKGLLAVSQLLTWQHSVIVNDIKGELFQATAGYRATIGDVYVLDPTGVGHCFDPLSAKETEDKLFTAALQMLHEASEKEPFWTQKAARMLQQLFLAAKKERLPCFAYIRHMSCMGLAEVAKRLHTIDPSLVNQFLDAAFEQADFSNKTLQSAWTTLTTKLHPFLTETVVRSLTHSDFTPEQLMRGTRPVTLYLRWKEQDFLSLVPLVKLTWSSLIAELITTYDSTQGNGCKPVLLLIDEAGRTPIPDLFDHATTVVGRRIYLWVAVQSLAQLAVAYGRERAGVLRDNMETQLYYRPSDLTTAEYLEQSLGKQSAFAHSQTLKEGTETSQGLSEQSIPLITAQEIRHMQDDDIIGFHRRLYPFQIKRMDWRQHLSLRQRQGLKPPRLASLPPVSDIPDYAEAQQTDHQPTPYINPDMIMHDSGEPAIIDLFKREQTKDRLVN